MPNTPPRTALFVTCLVDLHRPQVGFASLKLLEHAGLPAEVPEAQTCCGQPAFNSGDRKHAQAIARQVIATFEDYDRVVAPSGSCAGMLHLHYPELLADDPDWAARATAFAAKVEELSECLVIDDPAELRAFLDRGGVVAWGIVPNTARRSGATPTWAPTASSSTCTRPPTAAGCWCCTGTSSIPR